MREQTTEGANLQTLTFNVRNTEQSFSAIQRYKKEALKSQFKDTFEVFFSGVFTMKMVAENINGDRANICRYVAKLRKSNSIYYVKQDRCKITNCLVGYYTTNKDLAPTDNQLNLFTV